MEINIHTVDKIVVSEKDYIDYFLTHNYNENMFNSDGTINKNYNSFKKTGLIAKIFDEHWNETYQNNKDLIDKYRCNATTEVEKIINCYNKNLGCSVYECPDCNEIVFVGHTCKSRFCTSCGYKYKLQRVENILSTAYNCKHRQIVFTIPKELRPIFFYPFEQRIDILFEAVRMTIYSILNETYKSKKKKRRLKKKYLSKTKYTPGFFAFLHTFGRDLKWNPHIHVLLAEIKLGSDSIYKNWNYFNFDSLSKRFQKILLDLLSKEIGPSFNKFKNNQYLKHKNGYYVYAEDKNFPTFQSGVEYVTRYCGRPAISENRIINYDGENVTFCYNNHVDEEYHEVTLSASEFIMTLLRHLIPYNYRTIRYYGFYRKKHKFHDKMIMMINPSKKIIRKQFFKHRLLILKYFNRDPYSCPKCGCVMNYACELLQGG